jgi:sensor histidine kinase regulating citrate/malate metabolism
MVQLNSETKEAPVPSQHFLQSLLILAIPTQFFLISKKLLVEDIFEELRDLMSQRIMIIDGAMGNNDKMIKRIQSKKHNKRLQKYYLI